MAAASRLAGIAIFLLPFASHTGKPSRPQESWIPTARKRKGIGLRSSGGWAAKERKNLAQARLARGRLAQEKPWDPSGKTGCQSRPSCAFGPASSAASPPSLLPPAVLRAASTAPCRHQAASSAAAPHSRLTSVGGPSMGGPSRNGGAATLASVALVVMAQETGGPCRGGLAPAATGAPPRTTPAAA